MIEPQALTLTHTDAAQQVATGKGVAVAVISDGIDVANPEFVRPDGSSVITDYKDFTGEGTNDATDAEEAFGDASSIAAQGRQTYDLSDQLPGFTFPKGCDFQMRGFAPGADLMMLKVFDHDGGGFTSTVVQAIQYAVEHHAAVINESLGSNLYPDSATDPFRLADAAAVAAGVTVVASTGDSGPTGTIGSPASDPSVISVGATTAYRLPALGYGYPGAIDNNIAALSSGGTTAGNRLVDLAAPGMVGMAACTVGPLWTGCQHATEVFGGTSQSAPFVSGAAALVIQAYMQTHSGARPTPELVRRLLTGTATDLGAPTDEQGAGLLDSAGAVQAASAWAVPGGSAHSTGLVLSTDQLSVSGRAGEVEHSSVAVTNTSNRPQTVTMSSSAVGTQTFDTEQTTTVAAPLPDTTGEGQLAAAPVTFTVPGNTPLLDADMTWPGAQNTGVLALALVDPHGRLAQISYDFGGAQSAANYQHVDVVQPEAGTWTAKVLWSNGVTLAQPIQPGSYRGPVRLRFSGHRYAAADVAPQTRPVPAGGTVVFPVTVALPAQAGDTPFSLRFTSGSDTALLPVARRTLVAVPSASARSTTFTATVTGGTGRSVNQVLAYYLDVAAGHRSLTIDLAAQNPGTQLVYYLVSPEQQILARDTNLAGPKSDTPSQYASLTVNDPAPGRWTLYVTLPGLISGTDFNEQLAGTVHVDTATAAAPGLPNSPTIVISKGSNKVVSVAVPNLGPADRQYFLDPRLDSMSTVPVMTTSGAASADVTLPSAPGAGWWVPSHTSELRATASAGAPVNLELSPWTASPLVLGVPGPSGTTVATAKAGQLAGGFWGTTITPVGAYGTTPAPSTTAKITMTALTQTTDPDAHPSTGSYWDITADWNPVYVAAGGTAHIDLTITPTAAPGTVVRGILYVDEAGAQEDVSNESELIGLPYTYTVG
ncbi:S8 family serine peptidase [Kutzneria buriramensis]|nr:S8 family serine peptidase [Kutzneria buriramensis]